MQLLINLKFWWPSFDIFGCHLEIFFFKKQWLKLLKTIEAFGAKVQLFLPINRMYFFHSEHPKNVECLN